MSEPFQNPAYDAATVVGPDDLLLLVSKEPLSSVDAADLQRRMPELARGRLVVPSACIRCGCAIWNGNVHRNGHTECDMWQVPGV